MKKLKTLRNKIDKIDNEILKHLNDRAQLSIDVGKIKSESAKPKFSPTRERQVYGRLIRLNKGKGPLLDKTIEAVYREIMSGSLALQTTYKIAYLGPEATFTHIAALKKFGHSLEYLECDSIKDVFTEVERDRASYGVVPIENSTEGAVNHTLDMFVDSNLKICSEAYLPIHHNLVSKLKKVSSIKTIYSHQQVFAQCRNWLEKNMPKAKLVPVTSTTIAAMYATLGRNRAAIASNLAAERYGLNILARSIEDSSHNITRLLIIGKQDERRTGRDKTSVLFSMKDKSGALHNALVPFKKNGINLTKIESRPSKKKAWRYYFFVDMQGHIADKKVAKALQQLKKSCSFLKVLGSYPEAR